MSAEILLFASAKHHVATWMPKPDEWIWSKPDGTAQGFGLNWRENVGRANLLWLALDLGRPPDRPYDWRGHQLCVMLTLYGEKMELGGLPLFDQAACLTLAQFRNLCQTAYFAAVPPVPNIAPLLATLATGRLLHAHP